MLKRSPDYQRITDRELAEQCEAHPRGCSSREMLLGQLVLFLLFVIAILLRSLSS